MITAKAEAKNIFLFIKSLDAATRIFHKDRSNEMKFGLSFHILSVEIIAIELNLFESG